MSHLIETVYNLLWGDLFTLPVGGGIGISLMAVLLLTAGVFFTLRTRLLPVRLFRDMIAAVCEKNQSRDSLSSFQTLIVSTATRVGMGNLVGVVAAVSAGGAGAVFWMWVTALLGASTSFVESTLAQKYRQPTRSMAGSAAAQLTTSMCWPSASGAKSCVIPSSRCCLPFRASSAGAASARSSATRSALPLPMRSPSRPL